MTKMKKRNNKLPRDNYKLWTNGRLFSLILLGFSILMVILSIVKVPFFSIFPGYTFGLLFGYYSYIIYLFIIYYTLTTLFNIKIYIIKFISKFKNLYYSWLNFSILILGIIILIETSFYIHNKCTVFPGINVWKTNFNNWWESFTTNKNPLLPNMNNSGIIINIITSLLYSIGGVIITIIISFLLIFYFIFYLFFSSPLKKINNIKTQKIEEKRKKKEHETKIVNLSFEEENKIIVSGFKTEIINTKLNKEEKGLTPVQMSLKNNVIEETTPFENPFDDVIIFEDNIEETNKRKLDDNVNAMIDSSKKIFGFDNSKTKGFKKPKIYQVTKEFGTTYKDLRKGRREK